VGRNWGEATSGAKLRTRPKGTTTTAGFSKGGTEKTTSMTERNPLLYIRQSAERNSTEKTKQIILPK